MPEVTRVTLAMLPNRLKATGPHSRCGYGQVSRKESIFGKSEESNGVPTSFRYVRDRLLEAAWGLPSSVSLDESAEVCFTACS